MQYFDEIQSWIIVFDNAAAHEKRWWHYFPFKMGHVYLLRDVNGSTLMLNPLEWGLAVRHENIDISEAVQHYAANAQAILSFTSDYRRNVAPVRRGFITCVSLCKAVLGLKNCRSITPFQLYKWLLKRGAIIIKPYVPYAGEKNYG